ncbi:hypothetical protein SAMN04487775_105129 [Treponema bryantii]|uniref:Lipoprotein n=2 Tax=Treponema bryantii TaxID=163 RepID=A0A1I3KS22_9SPIR|nr:hypothetical protein SAMN04487775_105129 [Treponema bryantii]
MKKIAILTLMTSLLLFTGCWSPIYEAIREDVKPEDPTVSGNIGTITRYTAGGTEYLFLAADDGLRYKQKDKNSHGEWGTYSIPFGLHSYDFDSSSHSGEQILSVLANSTTLYLVTAVYEHTSTEGLSYPSNIKLWGKTDGNDSWTLITENNSDLFPVTYNSSSTYYDSNFRVFQTNAPQKAHREAFIRAYDSENSAYKYYKLNGLSVPAEITIATSSIIDPEPSSDEGYTPVASSAAYFNGEVKFFTSPVSTTNETYTTDATYCYYTNGDSSIYYTNGSTTKKSDTSGDTVISALATCADSILVGYGKSSTGTSGGIDRILLTDGVPGAIAAFETNAQFQITSSYMVLALVNASPEKKEIESSLYASITFAGASYNFDNVGLWSYYPERGNWNRE